MIIRTANKNNVEDIERIHRDSILQLCKTHYSAEQLTAWTATLKPAKYITLLSTHRMFVAEDDGELFGFAIFDPNAGIINATYVKSQSVGHGVGRALLTATEADAVANGLSQINLNATLNAVGFYTRLGYENCGRGQNRLPTGVELPCVMMRKSLLAPR